MKRLVLTAVVVGALVLAGCSSKSDDATSGGDATTSTKPLGTTTTLAPSTTKVPKAEFITQADALCQAATSKLSDKPKSNESADVESWVTAVVASQRGQMAAIRAIGVPDQGEAEWDAIVAAHKKLYDYTESEISAISADPSIFLQPDSPIAKQQTALAAMYTTFGFKDCGKVT